MSALEQLQTVLAGVNDLERVAGVLEWDQETQLPSGGVAGRANQVETVSRIAHERFVSPEVGRLLERAEAETQTLPDDGDDRRLVRVTRRDYDYETKLPGELVGEMARAQAEAQPVWVEARRRSDWALFEPHMRRTVELARRVADAYGHTGRPLDALIARQEPGLTAADVERVFGELRAAIVPLVRQIAQRPAPPDVLDRAWLPADRQQQFGLDVATAMGYDLQRGRLDRSAHPFTIGLGRGDVRITTRIEHGLTSLYSTIHEAGHGMYEQGVGPALDRGPLGGGATSGVHESQSRLWENLVGRSRPFATYVVPRLRAAFPEVATGIDEDAYYRAVNLVRPSYIRVDADEVTYNLHIMLRTELEGELLDGTLRVEEVPDAWNAKLHEYLGLAAPAAAQGCLQDIHWTFPGLGSFVGYTLGNVIGPQLLATVRTTLPDLDGQIARGEFAPLHGWLLEHVYRHGRKFTPNELLQRITGEPISARHWVAYVKRKFGELYGLT
ncbi:MAG: carboxypeptidase M32 [Candidatus Dormiibacterota bacterium]